MAEQIKGMSNLLKAFDTFLNVVGDQQKVALKLTANAYKNDVQKKAPYKTGTYRRSIHVEFISAQLALVGSGLPYSKRLEYGYADTDKLGRTYNQAAQPHFRPAMDEGIKRYQKIYKEAVF